MIYLNEKIYAVVEGLFLLLILLVISSCNGLEPAHNIVVERCFPLMEVVNLEAVASVDAEPLYRGVCQCHSYKIGETFKRISDSVSKPLIYCNKEVTFKDYPKTLYPFLLEWSTFLKQNTKK